MSNKVAVQNSSPVVVIRAPAMVAFDPADFVDELQTTKELLEQSTRVILRPRDKDDFSRAGDLVRLMRIQAERFDESRIRRVKPHNDFVKEINAWFGIATKQLSSAEKHVRSLMDQWARDEERARQAQAEAERKRREDEALALAESSAAAGQKDVAEAIINNAANAPAPSTQVSKIRGAYGSTSGTRKIWIINVIDLKALPDEYIKAIMENDNAVSEIRTAIRHLTASLTANADPKNPPVVPGLEITQESKVTIR